MRCGAFREDCVDAEVVVVDDVVIRELETEAVLLSRALTCCSGATFLGGGNGGSSSSEPSLEIEMMLRSAGRGVCLRAPAREISGLCKGGNARLRAGEGDGARSDSSSSSSHLVSARLDRAIGKRPFTRDGEGGRLPSDSSSSSRLAVKVICLSVALDGEPRGEACFSDLRGDFCSTDSRVSESEETVERDRVRADDDRDPDPNPYPEPEPDETRSVVKRSSSTGDGCGESSLKKSSSIGNGRMVRGLVGEEVEAEAEAEARAAGADVAALGLGLDGPA